jgi:S-adenosylmethionine-diacylglycerol 3-amino-3-carboxypropyl transferase
VTDTISEIAAKADFSKVRYAQCWEDADLLVQGLNIGPDDRCLSIASAGDNSLSLLSQGPKAVVAVDLNPAQLHCLELRVGAYRHLDHSGLLELMGSRSSDNRRALYRAARADLSPEARRFWDAHEGELIALGLGGVGKFEQYFALFRKYVLPVVHSPATVTAALEARPTDDRQAFLSRTWKNKRWRLLTRLFFSRTIMGRLGRDPAFFTYAEGHFGDHIAARIDHAFAGLEPADNPYLQWILTGRHTTALPHALRAENFAPIRRNLDRLSWHLMSTEAYARQVQANGEHITCFNLSNIFEYMSEANFVAAMKGLIDVAGDGARFAYWNMMVQRRASQHLPQLVYDAAGSRALHDADKAFFYRDFILERLQA